MMSKSDTSTAAMPKLSPTSLGNTTRPLGSPKFPSSSPAPAAPPTSTEATTTGPSPSLALVTTSSRPGSDAPYPNSPPSLASLFAGLTTLVTILSRSAASPSTTLWPLASTTTTSTSGPLSPFPRANMRVIRI